MRTRICLAIASAVGLLYPTQSKASFSFDIAATLLSQSASSFDPLAPGSLLQLVNLGPDGVFNPLTFDSGTGQWVSGDDSLLLVSFSISGGAADFASAAAFDLSASTGAPGELIRVFTFESDAIPAGTKLGLRWFPGLEASSFDSLVGPADGQIYGEFTRQSSSLHGGSLWVVPSDGAVVTFDPLVTESQGGLDPNAAGLPSQTVSVIPEPGTAALGLIGLVYLAGRRNRRDR